MCTGSRNLRVLQRVLRRCQPCAPAASQHVAGQGSEPKFSITPARTFIGLELPQAVPSVCLPQALSWNEANSGPQLPHINLRRALPAGPAPLGLLPWGRLPGTRLAGRHPHQLPPHASTLCNSETSPDGVLIGYPHPCPGDQGLGAKPPGRAAGMWHGGARTQTLPQARPGSPPALYFIFQGQRGPLGLAPRPQHGSRGACAQGTGRGWPG